MSSSSSASRSRASWSQRRSDRVETLTAPARRPPVTNVADRLDTHREVARRRRLAELVCLALPDTHHPARVGLDDILRIDIEDLHRAEPASGAKHESDRLLCVAGDRFELLDLGLGESDLLAVLFLVGLEIHASGWRVNRAKGTGRLGFSA